jgi:transketolase
MTYEDLLYELIQKDDRYLVVTAENRAAIRGLPDKIGNKFIDTGITEQTMIGMSAGLALRGRIPITHALATFITMRAFEFIRTDVGIGNLPVKMVGAVPGFLSDGNGPTHQAIEDISIMRGIPNVNVFCPADEEDMLLGLPQVFASESPFYIRYNNLKPEIEHSKDFEIGKAEVIAEGKDVTILVYGFLLKEALKAKKLLEDKGLSVGLINLRTVKPIDEQAIINSAKNSGMLVTLEDHFITGGLYSIVGEILVGEIFLKNKITADVLPIALEDKWFKPGLLDDVLDYEGFTGEKIAGRIMNKISKQ